MSERGADRAEIQVKQDPISSIKQQSRTASRAFRVHVLTATEM